MAVCEISKLSWLSTTGDRNMEVETCDCMAAARRGRRLVDDEYDEGADEDVSVMLLLLHSRSCLGC